MPLGDTTLIPVVAVPRLVYNKAYLLRHHCTNITTPFLLHSYYKSLKGLHYSTQKSQRPLQSLREVCGVCGLGRAPLPNSHIDIDEMFLKLRNIFYIVSSECRAFSPISRPELLMWTNGSVAIFHPQKLAAGKICPQHPVFKALFRINM